MFRANDTPADVVDVLVEVCSGALTETLILQRDGPWDPRPPPTLMNLTTRLPRGGN